MRSAPSTNTRTHTDLEGWVHCLLFVQHGQHGQLRPGLSHESSTWGSSCQWTWASQGLQRAVNLSAALATHGNTTMQSRQCSQVMTSSCLCRTRLFPLEPTRQDVLLTSSQKKQSSWRLWMALGFLEFCWLCLSLFLLSTRLSEVKPFKTIQRQLTSDDACLAAEQTALWLHL